jgi:hypothetical protein
MAEGPEAGSGAVAAAGHGEEDEFLGVLRANLGAWRENNGFICSIRALPPSVPGVRHFILRFGQPTKTCPVPGVTVEVRAAAVRSADGDMQLQFRVDGALSVYSGHDMVDIGFSLIQRAHDALAARARGLTTDPAVRAAVSSAYDASRDKPPVIAAPLPTEGGTVG